MSGDPTVSSSSISQQVTLRLAPYLGEFNAEVWVKVVAERKLSLAPEDLTAGDLWTLLEGLRPSLNTFMGREAADDLLKKIGREVH